MVSHGFQVVRSGFRPSTVLCKTWLLCKLTICFTCQTKDIREDLPCTSTRNSKKKQPRCSKQSSYKILLQTGVFGGHHDTICLLRCLSFFFFGGGGAMTHFADLYSVQGCVIRKPRVLRSNHLQEDHHLPMGQKPKLRTPSEHPIQSNH